VVSSNSIRRARLVSLLEKRGIKQRRVLGAIGKIPRERFVEEALDGKAYEDGSLPIGDKQTISQPWIVARMTELLETDGNGKVLEIGTGSGYQAAILSQLFELVYSVERIPKLSRRARNVLRDLALENVHFKIFDGSYGWSEFAPYRAIMVTAAVPDLPLPLVEQLEEGGRIILPIDTAGGSDTQTLVCYTKSKGQLIRNEHGACRFVPLIGKYGKREK
jgi:protein-L-isoaspartate(D-aspartate) O-methyltransferase